MVDAAEWIGLATTCVAALLTASNLGVRVTGWGFVIFTFGAVAWITVGVATHQTQLLYSNIFLGLVDVFGVWRWLGHRARIADAAAAEERVSKRRAGEDLFSVGKLDGLAVTAAGGEVVAHAVDALAACAGGQIDFLIVRVGGVGGVGETLHRLPWAEVTVSDGTIRTGLDAGAVSRLPAAVEG